MAWATIAGDVLELAVGPDTAGALSAQLGAGNAAAVLPARERGVTAALVWTPGQTEPTAISAPGADGRRIAATFVGLVPDSTDADQVRFQEDGVRRAVERAHDERRAAWPARRVPRSRQRSGQLPSRDHRSAELTSGLDLRSATSARPPDRSSLRLPPDRRLVWRAVGPFSPTGGAQGVRVPRSGPTHPRLPGRRPTTRARPTRP